MWDLAAYRSYPTAKKQQDAQSCEAKVQNTGVTGRGCFQVTPEQSKVLKKNGHIPTGTASHGLEGMWMGKVKKDLQRLYLEKSALTETKNAHGKRKTVRFACGLGKRHGGRWAEDPI